VDSVSLQALFSHKPHLAIFASHIHNALTNFKERKLRRLIAWFKRLGRAPSSPTRSTMPAASWSEPADTPDIFVPSQPAAESQQAQHQYIPQDNSWQQPSCDTSFTDTTSSSIDYSSSTSCDTSSYTNP
jgi:hypothetical protein